MERASFEAPGRPSGSPAAEEAADGGARKGKTHPPRTKRPVRVALLVHDLLSRKRKTDKYVWQPHLDAKAFTHPEEITTHPRLLDRLREIGDRVKTDPWFSRMLICGPTGSGKEVIATWLHRIHPKRSVFPYIPVACGRLEGELVDSELFGHVQGAFTGAHEKRDGAFHTANGGVLLIDDLDALPIRTQAKLLRVIEDGVIRRVGSHTPEQVNVFLIVTTNIAPEKLVASGKLRADLYYRLRTSEYLLIPSLRERKDDAVRIAKLYWLHRNDIWSQRYAWPDELERWIRRADLRGDCRKLEEIVEYVHRYARRHWEGEKKTWLVPKEELDEMDQPLCLEEIPAGAGGAPSEDKGRRKPSRPGSSTPVANPTDLTSQSFFNELLDDCGHASLQDDQDLTRRFQCFLGLWADACAKKPQKASGLSRREIAMCLGVDFPSTKAAILKLLNGSANSMDIPRATLDPSASTGRGAKWVILVGKKTSIPPTTAATGDQGSPA